MNKIETGSKNIFRYDNVLDRQTCEQICEFLVNAKGRNLVSKTKSVDVPWMDNDTYKYTDIRDIHLRNRIHLHRHKVKNLVMFSYNSLAYIDFTDLVIWRSGKSQDRHRDDGYTDNDPLRSRKFSSVTYLNDNFDGGQTFIETEHGTDYISEPKTGSVVIYPSDDSSKHGVMMVNKGIRMTLPIWFCTDYLVSEEKRQEDN